MAPEVLLNFRNRRKLRTPLCAPFRPEENVVTVQVASGEKTDVPLTDLCYIGMAGPRPQLPQQQPAEEIELVTGERLLLHIRRDLVFKNGFFGVCPEHSAPFDRLFIISSAVKAPSREEAS